MISLYPTDYFKVKNTLDEVTINKLFAQTVIEQIMDGKVYADNAIEPSTFYIVHPYGMSLLLGKHDNEDFNLSFREYALNSTKERKTFEWMQPATPAWNEKIVALFDQMTIKATDNVTQNKTDKIELNTRINFAFEKRQYQSFLNNQVPEEAYIIRTTSRLFNEMPGSVVPKYFWRNADHFERSGVGFTLLYKDQIASTAYAAFIHDHQLELGIETVEKFRGKGYAQMVCSALIDYCLENNFKPVWSCRKENVASYQLAQTIGFRPTKEIPYYRLAI